MRVPRLLSIPVALAGALLLAWLPGLASPRRQEPAPAAYLPLVVGHASAPTLPTAWPSATQAATRAPTAAPTAAPTGAPLTPTRDPAVCAPEYPTVCIPPPPPDLDCADIPYRNFPVLPPDRHRFDGSDNDGIGCESAGRAPAGAA